ncbi:hypothetical protein LRD69_00310 [Streptomyces sp. JH14]|uniref:hypothetical protein n=1 Tax=Streptomyces sp. JH14 TaxID=2793630 RepID=UPI0023F8239B|nr:hypothetical protein [Streptomyces sp. JH14]MDF6040635.1 hypothetical protein [Streptomyces sp. JH14]
MNRVGVRLGAAVAGVLVTALAAVACGSGSEDLVIEGTPPAAPYSGPLHLPHPKVEADTAQARMTESGAAGRALECDGVIYSGGGSEPWSKGDGGARPEEGLKLHFEIEQPDLPQYGYRVERREADRVLYSFDVDGRTKIAVIVAKDGEGRPGWGPETAASCDPAELPSSYTDKQPYRVWTDKDGHRVPVAELSSSAGSAHCDWQEANFLERGAGSGEGPAGRKVYARDPKGVLPSGMLTSAYDGDVTMPADARSTGYHLDDWELWLTDDTSRVYVRTPDGVEAWPAVKEHMGCR